MLQPYPVSNPDLIDQSAANKVEWMKNIILGVRQIRAENDIKPSQSIPVLFDNWTKEDQDNYQSCEETLLKIAKLESVTWLDDASDTSQTAMALAGDLKILIPLAGLIDKDAEIARLNKEIDKQSANLEKTTARLENPSFADKAPEKVVNEARELQASQLAAIDQLKAQLEKISQL